ncbi:glycoside hydrolase family 2 protein [Paraburkholderia sp. DHOC27]|uniref:glycoside hydrolase family 2 protein n=1 Tax=Paraburkholderia sp. DHOC27 TaxID=2303330 RepID=UPI00385772FD
MSGLVRAEAFHLPERRVHERNELGLSIKTERTDDGWQLVIEAQRFARFVHIADSNYRAEHDWFHLAPNRPKTVRLLPVLQRNAHDVCNALVNDTQAAPSGEVRAINGNAPVFYP